MSLLFSNKTIFTFSGVDVIIRTAFCFIGIWCSIPNITLAAQASITGSDLSHLVVEHLDREGITGRPIIRENRVFSGCADVDIII